MALVLDTGALIAIDRDDRTVMAFVRDAQLKGMEVRTSSAAVAQAWRNGSRQGRLARMLQGIAEVSLDRSAARRIGGLLGACGSADVVDASIVDIASSGDEILTSDPHDLQRLAEAARIPIAITAIH